MMDRIGVRGSYASMTRRYFLLGAPALPALSQKAGRAARRKILIMLIDGFGPEYLEKSDMPNLKRMRREGGFRIGSAVMPSVTNVNNASVVTACFPDEHGITSNFFYDRLTRTYSEMETAGFLLRPTLFERARAAGLRTALVSAKDKVRTLCSKGAHVKVSAEVPEPKYIQAIGRREDMYSPAVNYWLLRAARHVFKHDGIDLMYLSTTDYMMHTYAPEEGPSLEHLHTLDKLLGDLVDDHPRLEVYVTADHGMNAKREAIDAALILQEKSIPSEMVPIIRDKHKTHHQNLGGAAYVFLERARDLSKAAEILANTPGVEAVHAAPEAARLFHLHPQRIGDLFVLATKDTAFGRLEKPREPARVRTHGSLHESQVPLITYGRKVNMTDYRYNLDLTRRLLLEGL
jgi:phosphonoacetate hydrolase